MAWRGDDMGAFARDCARAQDQATESATRIVASRFAKRVRRRVQQSFGTSWRVWNAKGLATGIKARKRGPGWYQIADRGYSRKRTEPMGLLWVFANAPTIRSSTGIYVAYPIKGAAPIFANGRRVMWPSEATAAGWQLEVEPVNGKNEKLVLGRRNSSEPWKPLWILKPNTKMPRRLGDLDAEFDRCAVQWPEVWADEVEKNLSKTPKRRAA